MHFETLENILNCVKYQKHLIQHDLNKIILLKLKNLRKFWNFYCKNSKNIENLCNKFQIIFKTFIKIFATFILKFIKLISKFHYLINLKWIARKDFGTFYMYFQGRSQYFGLGGQIGGNRKFFNFEKNLRKY